MTYGKKLWDALREDSARLGRKCTEAEFVAKADALLHDEKLASKKKPKGTPRERNLLWDELALSTGQRNLTEISRSAGRLIGTALADIKEALPDVTPEEIRRRADLYKRRHPTWTISAPALAKHWGEFSQFSEEERTRAAKDDVYQEPAGWVIIAANLYGQHAAVQMSAKGWLEIGTDYRRAILSKINAA